MCEQISLTEAELLGSVTYVDTAQIVIEIESSTGMSQISVGNLVAIETGKKHELLIALIDKVTRYFYPEDGYEVDKVIVDGKEVHQPSSSYTIEDIEGDVDVSVTFKPIESSAIKDGVLLCGCKTCGFWHTIFPSLSCSCPWCRRIPLVVVGGAIVLWYCWKKRKGR